MDVIGSNTKLGNNALIFYLDEDYTDYVVIADSDLTDYEQRILKLENELEIIKNELGME